MGEFLNQQFDMSILMHGCPWAALGCHQSSLWILDQHLWSKAPPFLPKGRAWNYLWVYIVPHAPENSGDGRGRDDGDNGNDGSGRWVGKAATSAATEVAGVMMTMARAGKMMGPGKVLKTIDKAKNNYWVLRIRKNNQPEAEIQKHAYFNTYPKIKWRTYV